MSVSHPHIKRISWTLLIPLNHPTAFIFRFYEENRAHLDLIMVLKPIKNGYKLPNLNLTNWHFSPLWLAVMGLATPWWWGWKNSRVGGSISVCGLFLCLWFMIMGIPTIRFNNQIQYHTEILFIDTNDFARRSWIGYVCRFITIFISWFIDVKGFILGFTIQDIPEGR